MISKIRDKQNRDKQGLPVVTFVKILVMHSFSLLIFFHFNAVLEIPVLMGL